MERARFDVKDEVYDPDLLRRVDRAFPWPWGTKYASRENFEWGYMALEGRLVASHLAAASDVLVLGAGNGREARPLARDGHRITCLDSVWMYLASGRKLFAAEGDTRVAFVRSDVREGLPFGDGVFDFTFFSLFSPLGADRFTAMREIRRTLRPGGRVLLTSHTLTYRQVFPPSEREGWFATDSEEEIRADAASAGFAVVEGGVDPDRREYRFTVLKRSRA
jgi:SAM-dependent methyltransferase